MVAVPSTYSKTTEKQLIDHCLNLKNTVKKGGHGWISDSTYNTCGTYNILEDKKYISC